MSCTFSGIRIYPYFRIPRIICNNVQRYKFYPKRNYALLLTSSEDLQQSSAFHSPSLSKNAFVPLTSLNFITRTSLWYFAMLVSFPSGGSLPVHPDLLPFRSRSLNSCMRGISSFKLQRRRENGEVMRRERWRRERSEMDGNERMGEDIEARRAEKK
jgi:hypothetical protein